MRIFRLDRALISVAFGAMLASAGIVVPACAQDAADATTALDAALDLARLLDGAGGGLSSEEFVETLQTAAAAGDPMALWQLGLMYESGEGVVQDKAKAFGYFAQIADEHADAAPKGMEADIVAHSFVKVGEAYSDGLPEAGIAKDEDYSFKLIKHAASYFGDPEAQYIVGKAYLDQANPDYSPLQSARWLALASRKGLSAAQAALGNLLFNGEGELEANPVEGLMWLTVAGRRGAGTPDEEWIAQFLNSAMSVATPQQRADAVQLADTLGVQFGGFAMATSEN